MLETLPCVLIVGGLSFYLGAQRIIPGDCSTPLVWKLGDNVSMPLTYTDWLPHEPNCNPSDPTAPESCLHTWNPRTTNYTWNDITCSFSACAICQLAGILVCLPYFITFVNIESECIG